MTLKSWQPHTPVFKKWTALEVKALWGQMFSCKMKQELENSNFSKDLQLEFGISNLPEGAKARSDHPEGE